MTRKDPLGSITIHQMFAEIKRRSRKLLKLYKQRKGLVKQLKLTDLAISRLGGADRAAGRRANVSAGRRYKNKLTLAEAINKVLRKDKPTRVADIVSGVQAIGYKSASKTFRTIIFQTLAKDKRFKQAGRGLYVLR